MAELSFQGNGHHDSAQHEDVTLFGRTDSDSFNAQLVVFYFDRCEGAHRYAPGQAEKIVASMAQEAFLVMGHQFPSGQDLARKLSTKDGLTEVETELNTRVAGMLKDFCLKPDGIELRALKTRDR